MTKQILDGVEAEGFDGMIQEGPGAFERYSGPLRCFVHHRHAGGWCERPGVMQIYGLSFCEVHGAEAKAGALAEIYHNAGNALEDLLGPEDSSANVAALAVIHAGIEEVRTRCIEAEKAQDDLVRRAYPVIPEQVDPETTEYDPFTPSEAFSPADVYMDARIHVHRLMRLSWSVGQYWSLESLEEHRESVSAQLAWALEDVERKVGKSA